MASELLVVKLNSEVSGAKEGGLVMELTTTPNSILELTALVSWTETELAVCEQFKAEAGERVVHTIGLLNERMLGKVIVSLELAGKFGVCFSLKV